MDVVFPSDSAFGVKKSKLPVVGLGARVTGPTDDYEAEIGPTRILSTHWEPVIHTDSTGTHKQLTVRVVLNQMAAVERSGLGNWSIRTKLPNVRRALIDRVTVEDGFTLRLWIRKNSGPDTDTLINYFVHGEGEDEHGNIWEDGFGGDHTPHTDNLIPVIYPQQPHHSQDNPESTAPVGDPQSVLDEVTPTYVSEPVFVAGEDLGAILPALLRGIGFQLESLYGAPMTRVARRVGENDIPFHEDTYVNTQKIINVPLPANWNTSVTLDGLWHEENLLDLDEDGTYDHYKWTYEIPQQSLLAAQPWTNKGTVYVESTLGFPADGGCFWAGGSKFYYESCGGPLLEEDVLPKSAVTADALNWLNLFSNAAVYTGQGLNYWTWTVYDKDAYATTGSYFGKSVKLNFYAGYPPTSWSLFPDENGEIVVYWNAEGPTKAVGREVSVVSAAAGTYTGGASKTVTFTPSSNNLNLSVGYYHLGITDAINFGYASNFDSEDGTGKRGFNIVHKIDETYGIHKTLSIKEGKLGIFGLPLTYDWWNATFSNMGSTVGLSAFYGVKKETDIPILEYLPVNTAVVSDVKPLNAQLAVYDPDVPWSGL